MAWRWGTLRRQAGSAITAGFFEGVARLAKLHPLSRPERHAVTHVRDLRYRDGLLREHLLDVYRPARAEGEGLAPLVFYIHGGGFRILSKDTHWVMGLSFARRGYAVFNTSYRLAPRHPFPCALEDVCDAFVWAIEHAKEHGADPSRVILAGESAGANLAASLAVLLAYERDEPWAKRVFATGVVPVAVIASCGVFQVSDMARLRRRKPSMSAFIADRLHEVEVAYLGGGDASSNRELADPLLVLERGVAPARPLPPFFLPVGTRDPLLPDTRRMVTALRALGATATPAYYPGEVHAFHAFVMRKSARQCWQDTFAFLDEHVPRV
ncbi:MAG: Esterase/lipase [Labilithrix sp.]|nr:Esterase/lipase [Labilithrix sp.]